MSHLLITDRLAALESAFDLLLSDFDDLNHSLADYINDAVFSAIQDLKHDLLLCLSQNLNLEP